MTRFSSNCAFLKYFNFLFVEQIEKVIAVKNWAGFIGGAFWRTLYFTLVNCQKCVKNRRTSDHRSIYKASDLRT